MADMNQGICTTTHFAQVVWKSSTKLGCGYAYDMTVCMYGPAGNVCGEHEGEVLTPQKTAAECGVSMMPTGIEAYLTTLPGKLRINCNAVCAFEGQGHAKIMR